MSEAPSEVTTTAETTEEPAEEQNENDKSVEENTKEEPETTNEENTSEEESNGFFSPKNFKYFSYKEIPLNRSKFEEPILAKEAGVEQISIILNQQNYR